MQFFFFFHRLHEFPFNVSPESDFLSNIIIFLCQLNMDLAQEKKGGLLI